MIDLRRQVLEEFAAAQRLASGLRELTRGPHVRVRRLWCGASALLWEWERRDFRRADAHRRRQADKRLIAQLRADRAAAGGAPWWS
jgi:hypothetical protein